METIDTRDLQERLEELEAERDEFVLNATTEREDEDGTSTSELTQWEEEARAQWEQENPDDDEELQELESLREEIGSEWRDGVQLIPERDFTEYAQELAEELGEITDNTQWPYTCIDWEWAARELRHDYSSIEYKGEDYLYRA
jgi:antirestriction protein